MKTTLRLLFALSALALAGCGTTPTPPAPAAADHEPAVWRPANPRYPTP